MPHPELDVRHPNAQTRGRRISEIRRDNYEEAAAEHRIAVSATYGAIDTVAEGAAAWGDPILVDGYDAIELYLRHTAGAATTAVHIAMQVGTFKGEWYDVMSDVNGDGTLTSLGYSADWDTADLNTCFRIPRVGRWMRFKVWTDGSDRAGSRATLYAARVMESM